MAVTEEAGKTLSWHLATEPPVTIKTAREMLHGTTTRWGLVRKYSGIAEFCFDYTGEKICSSVSFSELLASI